MTRDRSVQTILGRQLVRTASSVSVNASGKNRLCCSGEYPEFWYYILNSLEKAEDWYIKQKPQKVIQEKPQSSANKFSKQSNPNTKYIKIQMRATLPDLTGLTNSTSLTNLYSCTI